MQGPVRSAASLGWGPRHLGPGLKRYKLTSVQDGRLLIRIIVENSIKVQSRFFTFLSLFVLFFSPFWTVQVQPNEP